MSAARFPDAAPPCRGRAIGNQRGIALLIVLIIVALLTITVTEFTYSVQIDQHRTRNAIHALQANLLARSGINIMEGFLVMDKPYNQEPWDAKSDEWWLQLDEMCHQGLQLDESTHIKCRVRDESGKINVNNTRGVRRQTQGQTIKADTVLRDALKCLFVKFSIDPEIIDQLAEYWQQEPTLDAQGRPQTVPDFSSLEDFAARFGISTEEVTRIRPFVTAMPSRSATRLPKINVNTAPEEVLTAVLSADKLPECPPNESVARIVESQEGEEPIKNAGNIPVDDVKEEMRGAVRQVFDVKSSLYRLEASALTNVDPADPQSGGIGQTLSELVYRSPVRLPQADGPNWTLRALDWQKEGGARLFRRAPDDEDESDTLDETDDLTDDDDRLGG